MCADSSTPPSLKQFDDEIQRYKAMEKAMKALPATKCIGWIKVDAKPLKKALQGLVAKWTYTFIRFLQEKVANEVRDLEEFTTRANNVLDLKVGFDNLEEEQAAIAAIHEGTDASAVKQEWADDVRTPRRAQCQDAYAAAQRPDRRPARAPNVAPPRSQARRNLYAIMGVMRDVRVRDERTQQMFQPLKDTVALLKQYGVPVKDETVAQLDDGPMKWKALDKKKKQRTEALNAKVIAEQIEVRRRSDAFQKSVDAFSEHFQAKAPFHVKVRKRAGRVADHRLHRTRSSLRA